MADAEITQLFNQAQQYQVTGRLAQAEAICRQMLAKAPRHPDVLHLAGVIALQGNKVSLAVEYLRSAVSLNPNKPAFLANYGVALSSLGKYDEAVAAYEVSLAMRPESPETLINFGTTTTCDALWMGVPTITLIGSRAAGRAGWGILTAAGLPQCVADSPDQFVKIAVDLANDCIRLADLRRTLRPRVAQSSLADAKTFARNVESAYRSVWKAWCNSTL